MRRLLSVAATCLPLLVGAPVSAENMPPDIAAKIAAMGRVIAPPQTNAIYEPLLQQEPFPGIKIARDVKYGADDLNVLDVFSPENAGGAPRPVFVHVHGGGFIRGDKKTPNSPLLDNIPVWAARSGMIGINVNYRLAPKATWPSGPEDMAATIRWIRANIASYRRRPQPHLPDGVVGRRQPRRSLCRVSAISRCARQRTRRRDLPVRLAVRHHRVRHEAV